MEAATSEKTVFSTDTADNSAILGEEKLNKLIFKFSIPCIMSLLISSLYNIVDQIFIGNSSLSNGF